MRSLAVTLILVAGGFSGAGAQEVVGRKETVFNISERLASGDWLRIASPNGAIGITQGSGDRVEIRAEKEVRRGALEDVGFVVRKESGSLTVCAVFEDEDECGSNGNYQGHSGSRWRSRSEPSVNFTVRIPAGVRVKAATGNGDVSVVGAGSEVSATTGNGQVNVSGTTGEVTASTGNGRIVVDGARGPVEASTGNGDVRVTTSLGPVTASSGNGDIDVAMDRIEASSSMNFSTGNGRITITVPEGFGAELESNTGSGSISSDFPIRVRGRISPTRVRGTLGNGGGRLVMSSGSGDIAIRKR